MDRLKVGRNNMPPRHIILKKFRESNWESKFPKTPEVACREILSQDTTNGININ